MSTVSRGSFELTDLSRPHPHPAVSQLASSAASTKTGSNVGTSAAASTRDSSPARDPHFRQADRARRARGQPARQDSDETGLGRFEHGHRSSSGSYWARLKRWRYEEGSCAVEMFGACATILLVGMNDSATGANLPSMESTYHVSYNVISLVFLANTVGYFVSSVMHSWTLHHYGLRNTLLLAACFYIAGSLILAMRPPFGVVTVGLGLLGMGSGLYDAALTTVVAHYDSTALMSVMYAAFGVGAFISPFIIGSFVDRGIGWNLYYYVPLGLATLLSGLHILLFSSYVIPPDEAPVPSLPDAASSSNIAHDAAGQPHHTTPTPRQRLKRTMRYPLVWLGAGLTVLGFASTDITSSWLPSYLLSIKGAPAARSRYELAALWGGIALGRIVLGLPSAYFGEKVSTISFLGCVMAGLSVLWKVSNLAANTAAIVVTGFMLGPVTPNIISLTTSRVPPSLKSSVVGILIGLGLIGSALGPLIVGLVAQKVGLAMLPGVLIVISAVTLLGLIGVRSKKRED